MEKIGEKCEIAPSDQHSNEWLNSNLATYIPDNIPMGETLKRVWTPTGVCSVAPVRIKLQDDVELTIDWQECRWTTERELLGQVYLVKKVVPNTQRARASLQYLDTQIIVFTEQICRMTNSEFMPMIVYTRNSQRSVCVTALVAVAQSRESSNLQVMVSDDPADSGIFEVSFTYNNKQIRLGVDASNATGLIYTSDCDEFPEYTVCDSVPNMTPSPDVLKSRMEKSLSPSQAQKAENITFNVTSKDYNNNTSKSLTSEDDEMARFSWNGRMPPFDPSGRKRVDQRNTYIKAPFRDLSIRGPRAQKLKEQQWELECMPKR